MKIVKLILFVLIIIGSCDYPDFNTGRNIHLGKLNITHPFTDSEDNCMLFWGSGIYKGPLNADRMLNDIKFLDSYDSWGLFHEINDTIYLEQYGDRRKTYKSKLILTSDTSFILDWYGYKSSEFVLNKSKIKPDSSKLDFHKYLKDNY
ncbi:MAG: hypothetical protein KDC49_04465 [Saprospiraceae bacterium]|nr:hypothetical protein [Saprospiraceae bacterium]